MPKFTYRLLAAAGILIVILGACMADEATPTSMAALATVEVTRPTLTKTAAPPTQTTATMTKTAVSLTPILTPQPTRTPRSTPTPTNTPIPSPVWASDITVFIEVEDRDIVWSPTGNEFLSYTCLEETDGNENDTLTLFVAPDFVPVVLAQFDPVCKSRTDKIWSQDGESILFSGPLTNVENDQVFADESQVWVTDRFGENPYSLQPEEYIRWLNFLGWLDEQTVAYSGYTGGGGNEVKILDVLTGEVLAFGFVHGSFHYPSQDFIPGDDGMDYWSQVSAIVISSEINELESNPYDRYMYFLSYDQTEIRFLFNSHFEDWLPGTSQMLALTWEEGISLWGDALYEYGSEAQLQLWDVENDNIIPLVEGAVHGRFSPDGQTLSYLTVGSLDLEEMLVDEEGRPFLYRQLMDMNQNQVSLSLPSSAEINLDKGPIKNYDSFSPNSRLFAFFTPGRVIADANGNPIDVEIELVDGEIVSFLNIYDLSSGQILYAVPAGKTQPVWSPHSDKLVFRSQQGDLTILNVADGRQTPLTTSGGSRLSEPQWSYDGRYLSVRICLCDGWRSAVLLAP